MGARSLRTAALGATIAALAIVAPAARVDAASRSGCTTDSGVTVIVDFTHFQGNIERGCAPGQPATALAALRAAGFETAGTTRYGDAFLCRIDNRPSPKAEACNDTPPANSSWAFYYAHSDDPAWTYSNAGVSSYRPPPGTIVAYAFGRYAKPSVRPAAVMPKPPPAATTAPPPATDVPASPPVVAAAVTTTTSPAPATVTTRPLAPAPTSSRAARTGTTTSTHPTASARAAPHVVDRPSGARQDASGSPIAVLMTVALVTLLAAGATVTIRNRRRRAT